jgi:hypothetical protein
MNTSNFVVTWNTRGNGEANQEVSFSLTAAPCNNLTFPQWFLTQCQENPKFLTAASDSFILAIKPTCQRIAKDSLNRVMTGDFVQVVDALVNGTPARSKYLEQSEAEALATILMEYWIKEGANSTKPDTVRSMANALLIGALTNKPPKGSNAQVLAKVRESWSTRLTNASIEVPPALIPVAATAIDESAF